MPQSLFSLA